MARSGFRVIALRPFLPPTTLNHHSKAAVHVGAGIATVIRHQPGSFCIGFRCRFVNVRGSAINMSDSPLASRRILVVDDVPAFLQEMRGILKAHCRAVTICTSPLRALRRLRADPPDLLITTLV